MFMGRSCQGQVVRRAHPGFCTRVREPVEKCDTRNLAQPFVFVYETIKSRQLGLWLV